jgi:hypothetical protein
LVNFLWDCRFRAPEDRFIGKIFILRGGIPWGKKARNLVGLKKIVYTSVALRVIPVSIYAPRSEYFDTALPFGWNGGHFQLFQHKIATKKEID